MFIPGSQVCINILKSLLYSQGKEEKSYEHGTWHRKIIRKTPAPIYKTLSILGIEGSPQLDKEHLQKFYSKHHT